MEYQQDIFYNIEALSEEDRLKLFSEATEMSDDIAIDRIVGWQRQRRPDINPQEWLINNLKHDSLWRFILRRGYSDTYQGQVVIREGGDFIWVNISEDQLNELVKKYNLKSL